MLPVRASRGDGEGSASPGKGAHHVFAFPQLVSLGTARPARAGDAPAADALGIASIGHVGMRFNGVEVKPAVLTAADSAIALNGSQWSLVPAANAEAFSRENIADIGFVGIYEKRSD